MWSLITPSLGSKYCIEFWNPWTITILFILVRKNYFKYYIYSLLHVLVVYLLFIATKLTYMLCILLKSNHGYHIVGASCVIESLQMHLKCLTSFQFSSSLERLILVDRLLCHFNGFIVSSNSTYRQSLKSQYISWAFCRIFCRKLRFFPIISSPLTRF